MSHKCFNGLNHCVGHGSNNAVDDGWCIMWNGTRTERDSFSITDDGSIKGYKVSELILNYEKLNDAIAMVTTFSDTDDSIQEEMVTINAFRFGDTDLVVGGHSDGIAPFVASAPAGTYVYEDTTITIPSDGTYLVYMIGEVDMYINLLAKPTEV